MWLINRESYEEPARIADALVAIAGELRESAVVSLDNEPVFPAAEEMLFVRRVARTPHGELTLLLELSYDEFAAPANGVHGRTTRPAAPPTTPGEVSQAS